VLEVQHVGLNNLPKELNAALAKTLGADPLLQSSLGAELLRQAQASGYANRFTALARSTPWRPEPVARPRAAGPTSATVVGPQGETEAAGAGEIHTDALGRIRVRFHWQAERDADSAAATAWVRVAQPYAGPGYGSHFIPRVGQEVLVGFIANDLDRPVVLGSLYNGQGEAGVPATPGGASAQADLAPLELSTDHRAGAQGNRIGTGHSPPWHGAGSAQQANAAAFSGLKSQEFGGAGYNQLAFDDSDAQLRVQLKTTQHETQLNLGHLVHQADNHRGSFRGVGFELRTDAWGAVRAGGGVLISSYGIAPGEPSGDNAAALALAQQAQSLAEAFSRAAGTHQTVREHTAPLKQQHTALSHQEPAGDAQVPHSGEPIIAIAAKAGLAVAAGQDLQFSNGQVLHLGAGQDTSLASGGALRVHTGQALAMLGGAVKAGSSGAAGSGLSFVAAQGNLTLQAQADAMELAAQKALNLQSASTKVEVASPKKITLATTGGASITLENGSLTVQCPGKITVKAATKSMVGAGSVSYALPAMPKAPFEFKPFKLDLRLTDTPGPHGAPLGHAAWEIVLLGGGQDYERTVMSGETDPEGRILLNDAQQDELAKLYSARPNDVWISTAGDLRPLSVSLERDWWTVEHKAAQAMAALDYSDDAPNGLGSDRPAAEASLAKRDHSKAPTALWDELKKL
jgi:type VI secretion system secreted protein VgrG